MTTPGIWSLREWADAIAALPVDPLPARTVLVPRLRVAHALKRELVAVAPTALIGTTFLTPTLVAKEVVALAGEPCAQGEDALRPTRLQALFDAAPAFKHFDAELLSTARGWAWAFSRTLGELEGAGVEPATLRATGDAQLGDLALALEHVARQGTTRTSAGLVRRAAQLLRAGAAWPFRGPTLVVVSGHESGVEAELFAAIPRAALRLLGQRPAATRWVTRAQALFPLASLPVEPPHASPHPSELALLQRYLFADPQVLAAAARPRSQGPDGTVALEEYAGVEAELEAAAEWVVQQVRAGRALDRLAVLVPHAEPLVSLLSARLQRVPFGDAALPVFVAGGDGALTTACGTRLLALLRALQSWLPADRMVELFTLLRVEREWPVDRDDALDLVSSLGTLGGTPGRPQGALEWLPAMERAQAQLTARIAELEESQELGDDAEAEARRLWQLERQRDALTALLPAARALHALAQLVVAEAPLRALGEELERALFDVRLLRLPPDSLAVAHRFRQELVLAYADDVTGQARGAEALDVCVEALGRLRRAVGRFGDANVYVGTVRGAVGLGFDAVRIIGLAEGSIPPALREDAVLPSRLREGLGVAALASREERGLREEHALFRVVAEARHHVSFSYPRADLSGSVHEPSSLFIEVAAALGRPNAATGAAAGAVPRASELERDAFTPARTQARAQRLAHPVSEAAWLERAALERKDMPARWGSVAALDPRHADELLEAERGDLDGYLGARAAGLRLRGLDAERPLSASRLKTLLQCPHRFLLETVLGWSEAGDVQPTGAVDALTYGTLVHRVLERFGREVGAKLASLKKAQAKQALDALAQEEFDALMQEYALLSEQVRAGQRRRLERDLSRYFELEWASRTTRTFVAVERGFGVDEALPIDADGGTLHVHGFIDRLDVEGGALLVRDYKTGKPHPLRGAEAAPVPELDAQLALYSAAARQQAKAWGTPRVVHAAYAYASDHEPLRLFDGALAEQLEAAGTEWLGVAREVLETRIFPRRPTVEGCRFCPFQVVCGSAGPARSHRFLSAPKTPLEERLAKLWAVAEPPEEDVEEPARQAKKKPAAKKPKAGKGAARAGKKGA